MGYYFDNQMLLYKVPLLNLFSFYQWLTNQNNNLNIFNSICHKKKCFHSRTVSVLESTLIYYSPFLYIVQGLSSVSWISYAVNYFNILVHIHDLSFLTYDHLDSNHWLQTNLFRWSMPYISSKKGAQLFDLWNKY